MRVWWPSLVLAIVFFGTDGLGLSTASAGYISAGDSQGMSLPSAPSSAPSQDVPQPEPDPIEQQLNNGLPLVPTTGGTSSTSTGAVDYAPCIFHGTVELTSQATGSQLLIDRSDTPPGNPVLDGILRPPRVD